MLSEAAAAVQAIKPTIEHGTIISKTENYKNTGVDRYIIAAKGNINGKESYVGVMVKAYPKARLNSKFYLHEATIIETDSHIMTAALKSNKTVSESASNPSIAKDKQNVNPSETNSSDKLGFSKETAEEFAENEKAAIEKALANMSDAEYNRIGWARTLFTREDVDKLSKVNGEKLKDGIVALKVNNKIVFSDGKAEAPTYYAVLVFDANTAEQVKTSSFYYFKGEGFSSLSQNDIRNLIERGKRYGTYGFYRSSYKRVGKEYSVQAGLPTGSKGFTDSAFLVVRGGVYSEDKGRVSRDIQGLNFSEETETSRNTLVSDMEAVAEAAKNEGKNPGMLLKDGTFAIEVNNKIVFSDDNFEDPSYYAVLVFDAENATDMELSKYIYLRERNYNELTKFDINRKILTEGNKFGTYGYNARDYKTSRKEFAGRAMLKSYTKGFGDVSQLIVRGGVYTKNERGVSRSVQGLNFSEETETSRDTLVSDMEAVAETDEEKSFVEKLKAEVEKANALQEELDEVNRKIKEDLFCIVQHIGHKRTYCYVCVQR